MILKNLRATKIVIFSLLFMVMVLNPLFAETIEYGGLGGKPAYLQVDNPRSKSIFIHTAEPGTVIEEGVRVINNKKETKTASVYAVDSVPSTGGVFACAQKSDPKDGVGSWIQLESSNVTLEPGSNEIVPFTINVPEEASVGEHNGCIIIQEEKTKEEGKAGAHISTRLGLRVAITIPGDLKRELEIVGFNINKRDDGTFLLHPKIKNEGNVSIDGDIKILTRYFFGLPYKEHGGQFPILRGKVLEQNFELKKPFWGGWYRSELTVEYDKGEEARIGVKSGENLTNLKSKPIWFFSYPKPAALTIEIIILLILIVLVVYFCKELRKKKWIKEEWTSYRVKEGENINSIAKKFGVSWKLIVKANKLKPPYELKSGQKIKTPPSRE